MTRREKIIFIFLLLFLLLPTLMGTVMAHDLHRFGIRMIYLISGLLFYAFFLVLNKRKTFFFLMTATLFFSAVEIVHLIMNHATTSILFVWTIITSERGEFLELVSTYWFVVVLFLGLWALYFHLVKRAIQDEFLIPEKKWRHRIATIIILFFLTAILGLHFNHTPPKWLTQNAEDTRTTAFVGVEKISPVNILMANYHIFHIWHELRNQQQALADFSFGIQPDYSGDDIVVLLIGETSRYDHWSVNGYERPTSPRLAARGDEIIRFDSCFTIANLTTVCVPFILSTATPEEPERFYSEKSVVEAFQEAGYHTAWIADQSFGNSFLQRISATCDMSYYPPRNQLTFMDTILISPFTEFLHQSGREMIVLHSLGCHFKYSSRYPKEFCLFQPDMEDINVRDIILDMNKEEGRLLRERSAIDELRQVLINSYDNAILYTDYFMDTVIQCLEQTHRSAILVYVGDHGENLLDDDRNMLMHGTFYGSRYEYHVPLFVWASPEYQQRYPNKIQAMRDNTHKTISTMTLFHSLLDMGNIPYRDLDTTMSIVRPELHSDSIVYGLDANLHKMEVTR